MDTGLDGVGPLGHLEFIIVLQHLGIGRDKGGGGDVPHRDTGSNCFSHLKPIKENASQHDLMKCDAELGSQIQIGGVAHLMQAYIANI